MNPGPVTSLSAGVAVVYREADHLDAIGEYSRQLVAALVEAGYSAAYIPDGLAGVRRRGLDPSAIILQYMPFSYGRWGAAPDLVRQARSIRRSTGAVLGVMVHEAWVHARNWPTRVLNAYQHAQLWSLLQAADAVFVSTQSLVGAVDRRAIHIPVGSNIAPSAVSRTNARRQLGLVDEFVVTLFGTGHPYRALEHAQAALGALAAERGGVGLTVLNLGAGAAPLRLPVGVRVDTPGELAAEDISLRLRASDLMLMTFVDGVSTRRTTLMAGLAHGVPVVGLRGTSTDRVLLERGDALALTPVGNRGAFIDAVLEMSRDHARRDALGLAGRSLYTEHFDWPVVADRLIRGLMPTYPTAPR